MTEVLRTPEGSIEVRDGDDVLVYRPLEVITPDGSVVAHESRGGDLVVARAVQVGEAWVEISHLGHGPEGGELIMVVTAPDGTTQVALGNLGTASIPEEVDLSWPTALDLAIGLIDEGTIDSGSKADLEDFHQRLLRALYGEPNV